MALKIIGDISRIIKLASELQKYGAEKNIISVFDDGGYRELLLAELFNLKLHLGRLGDDAIDELNHNYELKTVNLVDTSGNLRKNPGITTCHHINNEILHRYKNLHSWIVGIFFINEPVEIYEVPNKELFPYFELWEKQLLTSNVQHINNPKIRFIDIRTQGIKHYENRDLVEKYINGNIVAHTQVYKDILSFDKTKSNVVNNKLVAETEGVST